ncbi:RpoBC [Serratia phage BUCT660]|nr:RpoBC [Serratia phage BUCT660]
MPILSKADYHRVRKLAPHTGTFDLNKPHALNNNMALGAPVRATINNYLHRRK